MKSKHSPAGWKGNRQWKRPWENSGSSPESATGVRVRLSREGHYLHGFPPASYVWFHQCVSSTPSILSHTPSHTGKNKELFLLPIIPWLLPWLRTYFFNSSLPLIHSNHNPQLRQLMIHWLLSPLKPREIVILTYICITPKWSLDLIEYIYSKNQNAKRSPLSYFLSEIWESLSLYGWVWGT